MRAANDVPPVHAWSAVSTILRPPCPLVETDDRDAAVQFVPPSQVTSTVERRRCAVIEFEQNARIGDARIRRLRCGDNRDIAGLAGVAQRNRRQRRRGHRDVGGNALVAGNDRPRHVGCIVSLR